MFIKKSMLVFVLPFILAVSCVSILPRDQGQILMVVPARYTIIQLAFRLACLRPVTVIAYGDGSNVMSPVMHIWDGDAYNWTKINFAEYNSGSVFRKMPKTIIIIGNNKALLKNFIPSWYSTVNQMPIVDIMTLVNNLDSSLKFTPSEWKWLARRYELKLKDLNAERRRYGRYGKPGEKETVSAPQINQNFEKESKEIDDMLKIEDMLDKATAKSLKKEIPPEDK